MGHIHEFETNVVVLYPVKRAAEILCLSRATVYRLMQSGALTTVKVGKSRRIQASALEDFIKEHTEVGYDPSA